ncbi:hypothetical protein [Streptacidiphilus sp. EB103A]|uniref:hypothetical protein n=1 Tax=Streptacidiphilus sp. EB103A TaxID=3156275 RepID=UPI003515A045
MSQGRKSTPSLSHHQKIARALHQVCACGHQEALRRVAAAADQGLLPPVLDPAGRAAAVELLIALDRRGSGSLAGSGPILAEPLQQRMLRAFRAAHWPVEADEAPRSGTWTSWPGLVHAMLSRGKRPLFSPGPDDPDSPAGNDLAVEPEWVFIAPRIIGDDQGPEAMVLTLAGSTPAVDLVRKVSAALARARADEIAARRNRQACGVCGDRYPSEHLLAVTDAAHPRTCPACAFDDSLSDLHPLRLAIELDTLFDQDIALPAGWTAVAALLACAGGKELLERLQGPDSPQIVYGHWADPGTLWIPLPPTGTARPSALAGFGAGAHLAAVVEAVDRSHPQLRDIVRSRVGAEANADRHESEDALDPDDYFAPQLWPAVVAYAVCLGTQALERPGQRPPWHAVDQFAFDSLEDAFEQVSSNLADGIPGVYWTLTLGVEVVAAALGWPLPSSVTEGRG